MTVAFIFLSFINVIIAPFFIPQLLNVKFAALALIALFLATFSSFASVGVGLHLIKSLVFPFITAIFFIIL